MRTMNKLFVAASGIGLVMLTSCGRDPFQPGWEFMPDMYRSKSYETYTENHVFANGMEAQKPVPGTVARGYSLYPYANNPEGYEKAGAELRNPLAYSDQVVAEGKVLYTNFCAPCHGESGKGDGKVATNPKYPGPPPAYDGAQLQNLPDGKIFHSITFGKGNMGQHASQLTVEERWKLVHYVNKLQGRKSTELVLNSDSAATDSTAVN